MGWCPPWWRVGVIGPALRPGTAGPASRLLHTQQARLAMKGILLWLLGVPIPIIILIYLLT
ncbi:MAG: hypothetical protein AB7O56_13805 [Bauldia sp.]